MSSVMIKISNNPKTGIIYDFKFIDDPVSPFFYNNTVIFKETTNKTGDTDFLIFLVKGEKNILVKVDGSPLLYSSIKDKGILSPLAEGIEDYADPNF